ncbi:MAG: polysaccharide biosynthesis/export family protein [Gemmatimonadaceae bacterium]|nr:polysaccharide biosynthesis/export family protein [Gemmatimonadaceae bacterium]
MIIFSRLVFAVVLILQATILSAQESPVSEPRASALSPGDQVRIAVWRQPEFTGDFIVAGNGTITHPLYREIQVTGIPLATVEERLRTFLTRYVANPQFVVQPLVKIIVAGEVRSPNVYSVPPETTVAQAVVLAGGPTQLGRLDRVRIIRDGQETQVDLTSASSEIALLQIRSNDQVFVSRRTNLFRDTIVPVLSAIGAVAAVTNIFVR